MGPIRIRSYKIVKEIAFLKITWKIVVIKLINVIATNGGKCSEPFILLFDIFHILIV